MDMNDVTNFLPEWVSPPGVTICDMLEERGQSIAEFASAMGDTVDQVYDLLLGSMQITNDIANVLAKVLGVSAAFWLSRESQFRQGLMRLAKSEEWLAELPANDLIKFRWIRDASSKADKIAACLEFFGVPTVTEWHTHYEGQARLTAFRTSDTFDSDEGAVLAWLRKGELDGANIHCSEWNPEKFRLALPRIRSLTRERECSIFIPKLQELCAECGVAVVIARAPSGCRASGATRFLSNDKALLMLSFRYLSDDHFWFTFFHEAGHLLLHDHKTLFLEGGNLCSGKEEQEANEFSSSQLVNPEQQAAMQKLPVEGRAVMRFARDIGVSPGIIVGQLQHLGLFTRKQLNNLKVRYSWSEE
jgi:plasmid maintenance system antidote protein VapI